MYNSASAHCEGKMRKEILFWKCPKCGKTRDCVESYNQAKEIIKSCPLCDNVAMNLEIKDN